MTVARRTRRKEILKELGLTPLWRTRTEVHGRASAEKVEAAVEPASDLHVDAKEDRRAQILRMGWDELKASVEGCIACPLFQSRTRTVFGIGDKNADWLYVGEGPGAQEDATGEPFVGQAGKLLDNMLAAIDLKRGHNVYIANIVKCRPPTTEPPPLMRRINARRISRANRIDQAQANHRAGKSRGGEFAAHRCQSRQPSRQLASAFGYSCYCHLSPRLSAEDIAR